MRKVFASAVLAILLGVSAWAQEIRHEFTLQGSGFFPKEASKGSMTNKPTGSGGFMAGYRFNVKRWLAVEGDYDYFRNEQRFATTSSLIAIPMNVHAVTGTGIVKLPGIRNMYPFVLAGGGIMMFHPRETSRIANQTTGTFVYGGGFDVPMIKHVMMRAQYRGFLYKVPDFGTSTLHMDTFTHAAVPSAGFVLTF